MVNSSITTRVLSKVNNTFLLTIDLEVNNIIWLQSCLSSLPSGRSRLELDRYIGNTHHRGRLWDNRNHRNNRQSMTIGDQSVPMFHDDVTLRIHLAMGSIGHPCSTTIQGSA